MMTRMPLSVVMTLIVVTISTASTGNILTISPRGIVEPPIGVSPTPSPTTSSSSPDDDDIFAEGAPLPSDGVRDDASDNSNTIDADDTSHSPDPPTTAPPKGYRLSTTEMIAGIISPPSTPPHLSPL